MKIPMIPKKDLRMMEWLEARGHIVTPGFIRNSARWSYDVILNARSQ
jgi:hypothetical protein